LELLAQGLNQSAIAEKLQLPRSVISDDVIVLRQQSKERIKNHLQDRLPLVFEICLTRLEQSMRLAHGILNKIEDPRIKMQAVSIIDDSTAKYMDLLTHNGTIETAMSYSERMNKKLDSMVANTTARGVKESEENKEEGEEDKERQIV
jgi:hypothetical protein